MRTMRTLASGLMVAGVLVWGSVAALGQATDDIDLIESLGKKQLQKEKADAAREAAKTQGPNVEKLTDAQRRQLLMLEAMSGTAKLAERPPDTELIVGPPLNDREKVFHMLNRMAFGPTPGMVEEILQSGWDVWARAQLEPEKLDDAKAQALLNERFPFMAYNMGKLAQEKANRCDMYKMQGGCDRPECESNQYFYRGLPDYILTSAVHSKKQFAEVMYEFWRNHFAVDQHLVSKRMAYTAAAYERDVIRQHAFGRFEDLLLASARHPAMLEFLDNWISKRDNWNENYAREIMELHTLGADRYYNENDVLELTKVLTGWTFNENKQYLFRKDWHQEGAKKVLGVTIPEGEEGGEYAVKMLAQHPGTAEFISWKLCRYLVNDNPPRDLVRDITQVFRKTDGDLRKVYEAIIFHEQFMNAAHYRAKFKTPFEFTASALRSTGAELTNGAATASQLSGMGQAIYNCPDPTGYYDQAEAWLDSGVLIRRWDYSWKFVRGSVQGVKVPASFFEPYKSLKGDELKQKMIHELIGAAVGDHSGKVFSAAAETGDTTKLLSLILGDPAFQQQ